MIPTRSDSSHPLHPAAALTVTALGVLSMIAGATIGARTGVGLRSQIAVGTVLLAVPALTALAARPAALRSALGRAATGRTLAFSTALGASLWIGSVGLIEVQALFVPPSPEYLDFMRSIHGALAPSGPFDTLVSLAVIAVLPGLCEELLIRGVLLPALLRPLGAFGAVVVSAILFAAMHRDAYRFVFTLVIGLVFGYLRLRSASLWPPVVAHLTLNSLTFALAPLFDDPSKPYIPQPVLGFACLLAGSAIATPLLRALSRREAASGVAR